MGSILIYIYATEGRGAEGTSKKTTCMFVLGEKGYNQRYSAFVPFFYIKHSFLFPSRQPNWLIFQNLFSIYILACGCADYMNYSFL